MSNDEAKRLAGEILVLDGKGKNRTAYEEARFAGLLSRFGDHGDSAVSLQRAIGLARG